MTCKRVWPWLGPLLGIGVGVSTGGCEQAAPPFDELPLRDALRADPGVVASLPAESRVRLAARFEAARAADVKVDELPDDPGAAPVPAATWVELADRVRQARAAEPLLLGLIHERAAWPVAGDQGSAAPLPTLQGPAAGATRDLEERALTGHAGVELRILMAASGARRLERVVGWPVGAVALDDTVYVDAAWLVVLASSDDARAGQALDGGASEAGPPSGAGSAGGLLPDGRDAGSPENALSSTLRDLPATRRDAGASSSSTSTGWSSPSTSSSTSSSTSPPQVDPAAVQDACDTCASSCADDQSTDVGDATGAGYDDSGCDSGGDGGDDTTTSGGCDSGEGDTANSCAADSGGESEGGCHVLPRPRRHRQTPSAWLWTPLGYLFLRRRP